MLFYVYLKKLSVLAILTLLPLVASGQNLPAGQANRMLPERVGDFRAAGKTENLDPKQFEISQFTSAASRTYVSSGGQKFSASLVATSSDGAAYSALARRRVQVTGSSELMPANVGTDGFVYREGTSHNLTFFKGPIVVSVRDDGSDQSSEALRALGSALAETLDKGEADVPVLVKHLPGWPSVQDRALYILNHEELKKELSNQSVLDVLTFATGTEAVIANYDGSKLLIIEFKTPQLATDNDTRLAARIQELRSQGQTVPAAYRRVGNYSVFVFDAPNEQAANNLIDQVKYQQMVQWLGRNPTLYDRAANEFTRTTLGVFIAVVKASGLVIVGSLAMGGLLGALLFRMRRKQQRLAQAYSDAGGMLRLNIDELNATHDPARLIGPGN